MGMLEVFLLVSTRCSMYWRSFNDADAKSRLHAGDPAVGGIQLWEKGSRGSSTHTSEVGSTRNIQ